MEACNNVWIWVYNILIFNFSVSLNILCNAIPVLFMFQFAQDDFTDYPYCNMRLGDKLFSWNVRLTTSAKALAVEILLADSQIDAQTAH